MNIAEVKEPLRALFLIPTLTGGGAERVVLTLLKHLDRSRIQPTLAVVDTRAAAFLANVPEDIEFIDLGCTRVRYALPRIVRLIRHRRPDVVLSTLGHLNVALAAIRPLLPDTTRYVARETIVVSQGLSESPRAKWWAAAYRRFYRCLDHVVCQSEDMRDDLVRNFGIDDGRATVIHNPVDVVAVRAAAAIRSGEPARSTGLQLVAAGRLVPQKGFDLLIEALAACGRPEIELTLLGEGPQREALQRQAASLGLATRVHFLGFQANPYPFFASADAFVLSSRYEGLPNVVLEALACGTPVVALPAPGGIREILDGVPQCVIASEVSASALAAVLRQLGRLERVGDDAISRFTIPGALAAYERVLAPSRQDPA